MSVKSKDVTANYSCKRCLCVNFYDHYRVFCNFLHRYLQIKFEFAGKFSLFATFGNNIEYKARLITHMIGLWRTIKRWNILCPMRTTIIYDFVIILSFSTGNFRMYHFTNLCTYQCSLTHSLNGNYQQRIQNGISQDIKMSDVSATWFSSNNIEQRILEFTIRIMFQSKFIYNFILTP